MQINNFKRLEEEGERVYTERHEERVKAGILNSLNAFRLVGHVLDMYLPKIFSLFIVAAGGSISNKSKSYHPLSTPPSEIVDEETIDKKPGSPGEDHIIR